MLRSVLLLAVPATMGLIFLRIPIITLVFQRQEFTSLTTQMVAWALLWYTVGLVFHSLLEILVRAYYAMHDTKTPVLVGAAAMISSIGLSFAFSHLFSRWGWMPLGGLALAVSVSTGLEVSVLYLVMHKRLNGIPLKGIGRGVMAAVLGSLGMAIVLVVWLQVTRSMSNIITTLGGVVIGLGVYGLILIIMRVPEVDRVLLSIKHRLVKRK